MLTVVISRKSSQRFIDRYSTLFEPYCEAGKLAFCFWDEHGTDFSSALPELAGIVRGIKKWRAIVALPLTDEDQFQEPASPDNPFDFLCNSEEEPPVTESHIPLIRLTQMLGGVPLVNVHYVSRIVDTENHSQKMFIRRKESDEHLEQQQKKWEELNEKYSFHCDLPSQLYLFAARKPRNIKIPSVSDTEAMKRREIDSSMFWYRNRYPAKARFMIQDCTGPENAHYHEDLFQFWMTVLTLALNDLPTGAVEAYKVYQVVSKVDRNKVHRLFSDYYHRLGNAQYSANKQIVELQRSTKLAREQDDLPVYERDIPIQFELSTDKNLYVLSKNIGLAGDCPIHEEPWWHKVVQKSVRTLSKLFRSTDMTLDRASIACRYNTKVTDEEIYELDEYQYAEMDEQLTEIEKEILTFNTYAVLPLKKYRKDLQKAEKSAATSMKKRMSRRLTISAGLFALMIYLVGFIPDFIYQINQGNDFGAIFGIALLGCAIMAGAALACIFHFRTVIRAKIADYNGIVAKIIDDIRNAGDRFSEYLSKCCAYMRGRDMLQALKERTMISTEGIIMLSKHVERLGIQMDIINNWLMDFDLMALPDNGSFARVDFNFDIPPEKNRGYLIQLDLLQLDIPSVGGTICTAPYPFLTELDIHREAIFEVHKEPFETDGEEEMK